MSMDKKTRVILMGTLVTTLSIFTANTYTGGNHKNVRSTFNETYLVQNDILRDESNEMILSINNGGSIDALNGDNKDANLVALNTQNDKTADKPVLSRGGSGLSTVKTKPRSQAKTQIETGSNSALAYNEKDLFYRFVSAEAAGETFEGQLAVATVIMNRVKSSNFPNTITGVILDRSGGYQQFSPVLDGRINLPATDEAKRAVDTVLSGFRSFRSDIMYFVNPKKAESPWIMKNKTYFETIGNHDFYY